MHQQDDEPADLLLEWVLHENCDPLHEPDSNYSERLLWTVLGQLPLFNQALNELWVSAGVRKGEMMVKIANGPHEIF